MKKLVAERMEAESENQSDCTDYSMTGWRLGYAAASEDFIKTLNKLHQHDRKRACRLSSG